MTKELIERLWESDVASALTNEAARRIERLEAALRDISGHFDESYREGCLERSVGDRARAALGPELS